MNIIINYKMADLYSFVAALSRCYLLLSLAGLDGFRNEETVWSQLQ